MGSVGTRLSLGQGKEEGAFHLSKTQESKIKVATLMTRKKNTPVKCHGDFRLTPKTRRLDRSFIGG